MRTLMTVVFFSFFLLVSCEPDELKGTNYDVKEEGTKLIGKYVDPATGETEDFLYDRNWQPDRKRAAYDALEQKLLRTRAEIEEAQRTGNVELVFELISRVGDILGAKGKIGSDITEDKILR